MIRHADLIPTALHNPTSGTVRTIRPPHRWRMPDAFLVASALTALAMAVVLPTKAEAYCGSHGVMCYRAWTPEDRPGFLSRLRAPDGDYMGSIFLPLGNQSFLGLGLDCEPRGDVGIEDWDKACNERFSECLGECFAE